MSPVTGRKPLDWLLYGVLTCVWASAYAFTRLAVNLPDPARGLPPALVLSVRLTLGAVILLMVVMLLRKHFPPLSDRRRWMTMLAMGVIGMTLPFFVITIGQQTVPSSLAALYVAAAPLFVACLAHFAFKDERMTALKAAGLLVGFSGLALLFGPDAISAFGSASMTAQALCLLGTMFYACSSIIARGAPDMSPIVFAAGFVTMAAIVSWPGLTTVDFTALNPSLSSLAGVLCLGVFPTAIASLLYVILIRRTSATFLSLTGYSIPIVSTIIGYFAFDETQGPLALVAFALILSGVWLSQRAGTVVKSRPDPKAG